MDWRQATAFGDSTAQLRCDDRTANTTGMPIKMLAMLLFSLLSVLDLGMTVWFLIRANRGLRIQLVEERAQALRFSQDLEQSNYEREQYRGYWNNTFDENVTLQMELDKFNQRIEEARAADQQSIRRAEGVLDRALEEMVEFREMHPIWPLLAHDAGMSYFAQFPEDR